MTTAVNSGRKREIRELHRTIDPKAVIANVAKRNVRGACLKDSAIAKSCDCLLGTSFCGGLLETKHVVSLHIFFQKE
jgi:hypothetical protein